MSYTRLEDSFPRHPKVARLAKRAGMTRREAIGLLVDLWTFVLQARPGGMLDGFTDEDIEAVLEWAGPEGELVAALVTAGWLDRQADGSIEVHDWLTYAQGFKKAQAEKDRRTAAKAMKPADPSPVGHACATDDPPCATRAVERSGAERNEMSESSETIVVPSSAEPDSTPTSHELVATVLETAVLVLPMRKGQTYDVTERQVRKWMADFPGLDVLGELRKLRARWEADATKRPASKPQAAIVNWLTMGANMQAGRTAPRYETANDRILERSAKQREAEASGLWAIEGGSK